MNRLEKKILSTFEESLVRKVKTLLSEYIEIEYNFEEEKWVFPPALEGSIITTAELMIKYLMEEDDE